MSDGKIKTALSGMKEIMTFCGSIGLPRTEVSILQLKRDCGFPMKKVLNVWESDTEEIEKWRREYVSGKVEEPSSGRTARKIKGKK